MGLSRPSTAGDSIYDESHPFLGGNVRVAFAFEGFKAMSNLHSRHADINHNVKSPEHQKRRTATLQRRWPDGKGGISPLYWRYVDIRSLIRIEPHNGTLPDDNEGREYLHLLAHTAWSACKEPVALLQRDVPKIAPWADCGALLDDIAATWNARPVPYSARRAGKIIELTDDERTRARAWRLKPVDKTDKQLEDRQKRKRRIRERKRRAARKAETAPTRKPPTPAAEIMAATGVSRATAYRRLKPGGKRIPLTVSKPWLEAGFHCRRTWERHGRGVSNVATSGCENHETSTRCAGVSQIVRQKRVPDIIFLSLEDRGCGATDAAAASPGHPTPPDRNHGLARQGAVSDAAPCPSTRTDATAAKTVRACGTRPPTSDYPPQNPDDFDAAGDDDEVPAPECWPSDDDPPPDDHELTDFPPFDDDEAAWRDRVMGAAW
jgi:hypothetical protein